MEWLECICLVKFDIEIGQIVEWVQPQGILTPEDEKSISMLAFPDSNAFAQNVGHLKYVFRMRKSSKKSQFSLGFNLFIQKKDEDNPRGYTQKSIIILSTLPLVAFYYNILDIIHKNLGPSMRLSLQQAYEQILNWEAPSNKMMGLQLFDQQIVVEVPRYMMKCKNNVDEQSLEQNLSLKNMIQINDIRERGQFQETNIFSAIPYGLLTSLTKIWELIITNQPYMVVSDSPTQGSDFILGSISLISPLTFVGDFRPYFTIYDKDFQPIGQELENSIVRNIILGVTNPFFLKTFKKFPIVIRCDQQYSNSGCIQVYGREILISEDKSILKILMPIKNEETRAINNSVIKKFFKNLTLEFMGIFEMYFQMQHGELKRFIESEFMEFVKNQKLQFSNLFDNKNKMLKFYQNFIRSANFLAYLNEKRNRKLGI
ncbi:hypothetical protein pb186bvf_008320 [Paramecium bursaria]